MTLKLPLEAEAELEGAIIMAQMQLLRTPYLSHPNRISQAILDKVRDIIPEENEVKKILVLLEQRLIQFSSETTFPDLCSQITSEDEEGNLAFDYFYKPEKYNSLNKLLQKRIAEFYAILRCIAKHYYENFSISPFDINNFSQHANCEINLQLISIVGSVNWVIVFNDTSLPQIKSPQSGFYPAGLKSNPLIGNEYWRFYFDFLNRIETPALSQTERQRGLPRIRAKIASLIDKAAN